MCGGWVIKWAVCEWEMFCLLMFAFVESLVLWFKARISTWCKHKNLNKDICLRLM
jgi:hypothetical protein